MVADRAVILNGQSGQQARVRGRRRVRCAPVVRADERAELELVQEGGPRLETGRIGAVRIGGASRATDGIGAGRVDRDEHDAGAWVLRCIAHDDDLTPVQARTVEASVGRVLSFDPCAQAQVGVRFGVAPEREGSGMPARFARGLDSKCRLSDRSPGFGFVGTSIDRELDSSGFRQVGAREGDTEFEAPSARYRNRSRDERNAPIGRPGSSHVEPDGDETSVAGGPRWVLFGQR